MSVNLSSLQIVDVAEDDLAFFSHLHILDLSDNQLNYDHILNQMANLPQLGSLLLACNSISSLQVPIGVLKHLHTLDLSFNELHGDVLSLLARGVPSLTTLNLSSNCISSVPPEEELEGLQALEELILDSNDLVQFIQWRALDAVPRLRRLSLASNRVKRLKDDAPDSESGQVSYFQALEELDLSSNEIASCDSLLATRSFHSLKVIRLTDNPCMKGSLAAQQRIPGVLITAEDRKPWYLQGSGCFANKPKSTEPKLKLDLKNLKKVKGVREELASRQRPPSQIGVLDEEANQLLVSLRQADRVVLGNSPFFFGEEADTSPTVSVTAAVTSGILSDALSEDELDQIFQERRAAIERKFAQPAEEPASFMKTPPFPQRTLAPAEKPIVKTPSFAQSETARRSRKPTMMEDRRTTAAVAVEDTVKLPAISDTPFREAADVNSSSSASEANSPSRLGEGSSATPSGSITASPPTSSGKPSSTVRPSAFDPTVKKIVPDINVREAIQALRAAAMSEYAVAA